MITAHELQRAEALRVDMARRVTLCHEDGNKPAAFCLSCEDVDLLYRAVYLSLEEPAFLGIDVLSFGPRDYCFVNVEGGAYVIREESRQVFEPIFRAGGFGGAIEGIHPGKIWLIAELENGAGMVGEEKRGGSD